MSCGKKFLGFQAGSRRLWACPRGGFSLIELLVVIVIIGILAALAVPAINRVRSKSNTVVTMSNLRQLQMANVAYAMENNGFFVPNWPESSSAYQHGWWQYGPFVAYLGATVPPGTTHLGWDTWPQVAKTGQPANPLINTGGDKRDRFGTIGMNMSRFTHFTGGDPVPFPYNDAHYITGMLRQNSIAYPDDFIMFAEGAGYYVDYNRRLDWHNLEPARKDKQEIQGGIAFRNSGNVAYVVVASGAVKAIKPSDIQANTEAVQRMFYWNGVR